MLPRLVIPLEKYAGGANTRIEWQSFMECYSSNSTTDPSQCTAKSADYYECLHHKKEVRTSLLIRLFFNLNFH